MDKETKVIAPLDGSPPYFLMETLSIVMEYKTVEVYRIRLPVNVKRVVFSADCEVKDCDGFMLRIPRIEELELFATT